MIQLLILQSDMTLFCDSTHFKVELQNCTILATFENMQDTTNFCVDFYPILTTAAKRKCTEINTMRTRMTMTCKSVSFLKR